MDKSNKLPSKKHQKQQKQQRKKQNPLPTKIDRLPPAPQQQSSESQNADIDLNQLQPQQVEDMEVGFIIGEIQDAYYHSLKTILLRYAEITKTNNAEIADAVVENKAVGNVILADDEEEQEDDEDEDEEEQGEDDEENVYSILSVFPGSSKISKKIRSIVHKTVQKKQFPQEILTILKDPTTSVLINERLSNLPAFVVNSSHEVFKKDMQELKKNHPATYSSYFSGWLLNISQVQFQGQEDLQKLIYSKFQDFQMCKRARVWWLGDRNRTFKKKADMRNLYYLIQAEQYFEGVDQIKTYLQQ